MLETDPYRPPQGRVDDPIQASGNLELASRRSRFFAASVDGFIYAVIIIFMLAPVISGEASSSYTGTLFALLLMAAIFCINLYLLHAGGQTIGKKILKIKIVLKDGDRAGLGRIFLLRMLAPSIIGAVPYLGWLFGIVDSLWIFNADHRCIHDHMAGTVVIRA